MRFYTYPLLIITAAVLIGCAKVPDSVENPVMKIDYAILNNAEQYTVTLSAGVTNENPAVAFRNVRGNIDIAEPAGTGIFSRLGNLLPWSKRAVVRKFSFEIPVILPFQTGSIRVEETLTEEQMKPVMELLNIRKESLTADTKGEGFSLNIEDKYITLHFTSLEKRNIHKLLKEKLDEKNK